MRKVKAWCDAWRVEMPSGPAEYLRLSDGAAKKIKASRSVNSRLILPSEESSGGRDEVVIVGVLANKRASKAPFRFG
jgi:hypothetical protein